MPMEPLASFLVSWPNSGENLRGKSHPFFGGERWPRNVLGGGFTYLLFSPLFGEDFQFDYYFQMG